MSLIEDPPPSVVLPARRHPLRRAIARLPRLLHLPTARAERLRHLAESARLEERPDQLSLRLAVWGVTLSLVAVLTWASFARLPEIAHGTGQIAPESFEREVVHPEAGRILSIPVSSGLPVKAGDIVVRLDTEALDKQRQTLLARYRSLKLRIEALAAFTQGRSPDFSLAGGNLAETTSARNAHAALVQALADQRAILDEQVARNRTEGEIVERQILQAKATLDRLSDLRARNEVLFRRQLLTYPAIATARQNVADAEAALDILHKQKDNIVTAAAELDQRIASLVSSRMAEAAQDLQLARADMAETDVAMANLARAIASRSLRAPVDGTVHLPERLAVGDSVAAGQPIVFIIPAHDRLVARIRIPAREISEIHIGQRATLRITSFDYLRFGRLSGTILSISPAALSTDGGEIFYSAEVALDAQSLTLNGVVHPILPGMVVTADIINGSLTVLEYFLKPVNSALQEAFREG
jgi:HlyD family type I secretion membrane fusion protein